LANVNFFVSFFDITLPSDRITLGTFSSLPISAVAVHCVGARVETEVDLSDISRALIIILCAFKCFDWVIGADF